jgi:hypothetical protein
MACCTCPRCNRSMNLGECPQCGVATSFDELPDPEEMRAKLEAQLASSNARQLIRDVEEEERRKKRIEAARKERTKPLDHFEKNQVSDNLGWALMYLREAEDQGETRDLLLKALRNLGFGYKADQHMRKFV